MGHSSGPLVISKLWSTHPDLVLQGAISLYKKDASCLSKILELFQELNILHSVLESSDYFFTLDLVSLASSSTSRRVGSSDPSTSPPHFGNWLNDHLRRSTSSPSKESSSLGEKLSTIEVSSTPFFKACLQFLDDKVRLQVKRLDTNSEAFGTFVTAPLSVESVYTILEALHGHRR